MSNTIYNVVVSIINEVTGIDPESITLDSHIVDDLQIDSFAATEILGRFEEEFNITINATDFVGVYVISDIVNTLEELGATFDDGNIESYADTSDTAYLSTEHDIFSNGSKRVLTYKNMLDLMYDEDKVFKATSRINNSAVAPYNTENLLSYGSAKSPYLTTPDSFTINTAANDYENFNTGLTHYVTTATMTITMNISIAFSESTNFASNDDEDETNYNIAKASLDFDNEGTQSASVEDTGVAYTNNTSANVPALMSAGNNTRTGVATPCFLNSACNSGLTSDTCQNFDGSTICAKDNNLSTCTVTMNVSVDTCNNADIVEQCGESSNCTDPGDSTSCATMSIDLKYISYKATVCPNNSDTAIAQITATTSVLNIYETNSFPTTYIKVPALQYFHRTTTDPLNPFGFRINIIASANGIYSSYTIANSTITYNQPLYYVFNPNDKTVKYTTAKTLYDSYMQDYT